MDITGFLRRLGLTEAEPPTLPALRRIARAYVERVPYENVSIQLGRPVPLDPESAAAHIAGGRGGYCYTMNGALSWLLSGLGYRVSLHHGGVQDDGRPPEINLNHLVLTISGTEGTWLVDAGLGDGLHELLPLRPGRYSQGPFSYGLRPSELGEGLWRMDHDPQGAFPGMDFSIKPAEIEDFRAMNAWQSTSPDSHFVKTFTAQRRDADGVDILRGLTLRRVPGDRRTLETRAEFAAALADVFGLHLTADELDVLWPKALAQHEAWLSRRSAASGS